MHVSKSSKHSIWKTNLIWDFEKPFHMRLTFSPRNFPFGCLSNDVIELRSMFFRCNPWNCNTNQITIFQGSFPIWISSKRQFLQGWWISWLNVFCCQMTRYFFGLWKKWQAFFLPLYFPWKEDRNHKLFNLLIVLR